MALSAARHALCRRVLSGACLLAILAATPAVAGEVYKWKDAKGVTHYSDAPPASGRFENREIRHRPGMPAAAQARSEAPAANARCTEARTMLSQLQSGQPVGIDADGDGKADSVLNDTEKAAQGRVAEAAIAAHCETAPTASADA